MRYVMQEDCYWPDDVTLVLKEVGRDSGLDYLAQVIRDRD